MRRLAFVAAIALSACAAPQRRVVAPDVTVPCQREDCGGNGTRLTGLRGDDSTTTIRLVAIPGAQRRLVAPNLVEVHCETALCGTNGTRLTGLRGDHAPTTIRLLALPVGAR